MPPPRQPEASPHEGEKPKAEGVRYYEKDIYHSLSGDNKGKCREHAGCKHKLADVQRR